MIDIENITEAGNKTNCSTKSFYFIKSLKVDLINLSDSKANSLHKLYSKDYSDVYTRVIKMVKDYHTTGDFQNYVRERSKLADLVNHDRQTLNTMVSVVVKLIDKI